MLVLLEARLVMLMRLLTWRLPLYHCSSSTHACFIGGEIGDADEAFDVEVRSLCLSRDALRVGLYFTLLTFHRLPLMMQVLYANSHTHTQIYTHRYTKTRIHAHVNTHKHTFSQCVTHKRKHMLLCAGTMYKDFASRPGSTPHFETPLQDCSTPG
jgi:hypothetical protein